jgi:membrane-associated phospholipid phosphatase
MSIKNLIHKYSHAWVLLYVFIYLPWFAWLEKNVTTQFHEVHMAIDDKIPFCEYFIVPYVLWFFYVAATIIYEFFYSREEYYHTCAFLFIGMTIFLIICTIWPNGLNLRQDIAYKDNIFAKAVQILYKADTSTNVFPSVHVFNSIGCFIALLKSKGTKKHPVIKVLAGILTVAIILSTMFLKQHSAADVLGGIFLAGIMYVAVYVPNWGTETDVTELASAEVKR